MEPTHADLHRAIGQLEGRTSNIENRLQDVALDVKGLVAISEQQKGSWKVVVALASSSALIGALVGKIFPKLFS